MKFWNYLKLGIEYVSITIIECRCIDKWYLSYILLVGYYSSIIGIHLFVHVQYSIYTLSFYVINHSVIFINTSLHDLYNLWFFFQMLAEAVIQQELALSLSQKQVRKFSVFHFSITTCQNNISNIFNLQSCLVYKIFMVLPIHFKKSLIISTSH